MSDADLSASNAPVATNVLKILVTEDVGGGVEDGPVRAGAAELAAFLSSYFTSSGDFSTAIAALQADDAIVVVRPYRGLPPNTFGKNGELTFDDQAKALYGPKVAGAWPSTPASLAGPSAYAGTSDSNVTIGTGSITFSTQSGLSWKAGFRARVAADANNWVEGVVTAYSGTNLVIAVDAIAGAGTFTSWNIGPAGQVGASGIVSFDTLANLNAELAYPARTPAEVYNDPPNNGTYVKSGASGTGSWAKTSDLTLPGVRDSVTKALTSSTEMAQRLQSAAATPLNGAVLVYDGNLPIGYTIPAGSTGLYTLLRVYPRFETAWIASHIGRTITIRLVAETSTGLFDNSTFQVKPHYLTSVNNYYGSLGTVTKISASLVQADVTYVIAGNEMLLGMSVQLVNAIVATAPEHLTVQSVTWFLSDVQARSAIGVGGENTANVIRTTAASKIASVSIFDAITIPSLQNFNQATTQYSYDRPMGIKIPQGGTGPLSYVDYLYLFDAADVSRFVGRNIRVALTFLTSSNFARPLTLVLRFVVPGVGFVMPADMSVLSNKQTTGFERIVELSGTVPSNATGLKCSIQIGSNDAVTTQDDIILLTEAVLEFLTTTSNSLTDAGETAQFSHGLAARKALVAAAGPDKFRYAAQVLIPDLVGNGRGFGAILSAVTGIKNATATRPYELVVEPGTYTLDINWYAAAHVDVRSRYRHGAVFVGHQAANASISDVANNSVIQAYQTCSIKGLKGTAQNMRYVMHSDPFNSCPGQQLLVEDCHFQHLGNDEANNYQISQGVNPSLLWTGCLAIGFALEDGAEQVYRDLTLIGYKYSPLGGHNNVNHTAASRLVVERCVLDPGFVDETSPSWRSFLIGQLGSGQTDKIVMRDNVLLAPIKLHFRPYIDTTPAMQLAYKATYAWTGHGNTPAPFTLDDSGERALRIDSAAKGTSSSISVSGTAVSALFGNVVNEPGDVGLSGFVYGTWDVGDHPVGLNLDQNITKLGYRLGDCSSSSKTLLISVDGGANVTVTFNADYRAVSNATILAMINAALGASATASLWNVNDLFRPLFTDEETRIRNTSSTTIMPKTAVAYGDASRVNGRTMTNGDPATAFAGIAYEIIRPGASGRVKKRGAVRVSMDVLRSDAGAFTAGQTFGVGATAGLFTLGAATPLLTATNTLDVAWGNG